MLLLINEYTFTYAAQSLRKYAQLIIDTMKGDRIASFSLGFQYLFNGKAVKIPNYQGYIMLPIVFVGLPPCTVSPQRPAVSYRSLDPPMDPHVHQWRPPIT